MTLHNPPSPTSAPPAPPHSPSSSSTFSHLHPARSVPRAFALAVYFARNTFSVICPRWAASPHLGLSSNVTSSGRPSWTALSQGPPRSHSPSPSFISILVLFLLAVVVFCVYYLSPPLDHQLQDFLFVLFSGAHTVPST